MEAIVGFFILACVAAFVIGEVRGRRISPAHHDPLRVVVTSAMHEAAVRGQEMSHAHLALALTFDPEVAMRLAHVGPIGDLRDRLEGLLRERPAEAPADPVGVPDPYDPTILRYTEQLQGTDPIRSPAGYLGVLLDAIAADGDVSPDVHAAFEASGLTPATWRATAGKTSSVDPPRASVDYRGRVPAPTPDTFVRLRNDDVTTQARVMELLTETFGLGATEARDVMLRTHLLGTASFGPFAREDAEALVATALARARAAGSRPTIEVENAGMEAPSGRRGTRS